LSESMHLGLDNPAFNGRLRAPAKGPFDRYVPPRPSKRYFDQQIRKSSPSKPAVDTPAPIWARPLSAPGPAASGPEPIIEQAFEEAAIEPEVPIAETPVAAQTLAGAPPAAWVEPQPFDFANTSRKRHPFRTGTGPARFFKRVPPMIRQLDPRRLRGLPEAIRSGRYSRLQMALTGMAVVVFVLGLMVSFQSAQTNHKNAAKVSALSKSTDQGNGGGSVPSTAKPSGSAVRNYTVAPDLPRYIKIPKLGVNARVMQAGVKSDGSLGTPGNVYDAAWYTGSSKPGQPGAMLIDGHVSSWTTRGVFYGLKRLVAGDIIQVQRGDGQVFAYKVVKTQTYPDNNVDMQAAVRPITPGKPGLNLITCTGRVKPGTSEFNQRIIVFAEQI
jgi:sortase (surface protein transpeptidase)